MAFINKMAIKDKIVIICGPTASGKSKFASDLALLIDGIIINSDAVQVYKELPLLTSSPIIDQSSPPHKLYNIISCSSDSGKSFSVQNWLDLAYQEIIFAKNANKTPIIVGGSGMYISSLLYGISYIPEITKDFQKQSQTLLEKIGIQSMHQMLMKIDSDLGAKVKENDKYRISRGLEVFWQTGLPLSYWHNKGRVSLYKRDDFYIISFLPIREVLYQNINQRFFMMLQQGVIEEVKKLKNIDHHKAIGFKEIKNYIDGITDIESMIYKVQQYTRNYAKRQMTWFRNQIEHDIALP